MRVEGPEWQQTAEAHAPAGRREESRAPVGRREESRAPAVRREEATDLRDRVMLLFRAGFAASLIASRVGVPLGEVELIISLEQRKGQG